MLDPAIATEKAMVERELKVVARVQENLRATDFAIAAPNSKFCVVRCVPHAAPDDYRALKAMLTQGDFDRAFLVYTAEDQPHLPGEIESYPLSRIDELAASLARESAK